MKWIKNLAVLAVALMTANGAWAAKYGDAVLEEGRMIILRDKKPIVFTADKAKGTIPIQEKDLIRMGPDSKVVIKSNEKAEITLGANAIMHIQDWNQRQKSGKSRMLFGRFRAKVSGLVTGEQFNVKTATATIGVKGTEYIGVVTSNGNTTMIPVENVVQIEGLDGLVQDVTPGQISVVVGGQRATPPTRVPKELRQDMFSDKLTSPGVESNAANLLPGESQMMQAGILDENLLMESKIEEFTLEQALLKPVGEIEAFQKEGRSYTREAEIK